MQGDEPVLRRHTSTDSVAGIEPASHSLSLSLSLSLSFSLSLLCNRPFRFSPVSFLRTAPSAAPTASPRANVVPSAAPTAVPTAATTVAEMELDFLGAGLISGSFSAHGVSDDVLAWLGEEGVARQVRASLPCFSAGTARSWLAPRAHTPLGCSPGKSHLVLMMKTAERLQCWFPAMRVVEAMWSRIPAPRRFYVRMSGQDALFHRYVSRVLLCRLVMRGSLTAPRGEAARERLTRAPSYRSRASNLRFV